MLDLLAAATIWMLFILVAFFTICMILQLLGVIVVLLWRMGVWAYYKAREVVA